MTVPNPITREQAEANLTKLNSPPERAALLRRITMRQCFFDGSPTESGWAKALDAARERIASSGLDKRGAALDEMAIVEKAVDEFRAAEEEFNARKNQLPMIALADQFIPTMALDAANWIALNPPKLPGK